MRDWLESIGGALVGIGTVIFAAGMLWAGLGPTDAGGNPIDEAAWRAGAGIVIGGALIYIGEFLRDEL